MKKRIAIFVVLAMVLCLALTGCGQRTEMDSIGNAEGGGASDFVNRNDGLAEDGSTTNGEWEAEPEEGYSGTVWDIMGDDAPIDRPDSDSNNTGSYSYEVVGHTLVLNTNLNEYINGDVFLFNKLATDFGWHSRRPEDAGKADLMRYFYGDDNELEVGFNSPSDNLYLQLNADNEITGATAYFTYAKSSILSAEKLYIVNPGGAMSISFEQVVLVVYLFENIPEATEGFLRDVFFFENGICYL